ncbi:MAG: hypothetical protein WC835_00445 [Candidatus Paceibacterota bacterium]
MDKHDTKKENQPMVSWRGYEYEYREKTRDWYWALVIVSIAVAIAAIIFQNYLFAVLIIVSAFSVAVHSYQPPEEKEFRIDERGIKIGKKLYTYQNIESFWINDKMQPPQLFFKLKRPILPLIIIPIGTANSEKIKEILFNNLHEEEHAVPISESIMDFLGF